MKRQILLLLLATFSLTCSYVTAQTPYDNFAPEQGEKEMLQLPKTQFQISNNELKDSIHYLIFDKDKLTLSLYKTDNSKIGTIKINPFNSKFTTIDRFAEKYPWQSPYCYAANNPVRYIDVNGDSIGVNQSVYNNSVVNESFKLFATSKDGRKFLANYASKGQTLYGYTFEKAGKYDKAGVNLEYTTYSSADPGSRGQTTHSSDGTITVGINSLNQIDSQDNSSYDWGSNYSSSKQLANQMTYGVVSKTITFFHESFIHANLFTGDYMDNRQFDYSNISSDIKNHANFYGIPNNQLQHQQVYWNGNNSLWPGSAYRGIVETNSAFGQRYNNQQLYKMMWNYNGGR